MRVIRSGRSLPGFARLGGFRGDWYLGIASGSVSLVTGWKVIRQLCARGRDPAKLDSGIGLPVWRGYYQPEDGGKGPAWPGASQSLQDVGWIWQRAKRRSDFVGYIDVHGFFREAFLEIFGDAERGVPASSKRHISRVVNVMRARMGRLLDRSE